MHVTSRVRTRPGFTLIEIISVLAVIAILAALLFPAVRGASTAAKRAKTKVQFSQWATALEAFRQEYGYYPNFTAFTNGMINSTADTTQFVEALSGRKVDGTPLDPDGPGELAGNTKHITFCTFAADDIARGYLQDAFKLPAPQIVVLVDKNADGFVQDSTGSNPDYSGSAPWFGTFSPNFPAAGIRAGVIFYSPGAGESADDIVKSWK